MTVDEIVDDVFRRIGQKRSADNERVSDADVLAALNQAYVQWAMDAECFKRTRVITTDDNVAAYDLDVDIHRIEGAWYGATYLPLVETSVTTLDANAGSAIRLVDAGTTWVQPMAGFNWRFATSGTPSAWYRDGEQFALYVPPDTADVDVTLRVCIVPSSLNDVTAVPLFTDATANDEYPAFGAAYHQALVEGAILRMALQLPTLPNMKELVGRAAVEYRNWVSQYLYAKAPTGGV